MRALARDVVVLARALERAHGGAYPYRHDHAPELEPLLPLRVERAALAALAVVGLWVIFARLSPPPTFGWRAFHLGAAVGVALWLATGALAAMTFRGRPSSMVVVLVMMGFTFVVIPTGGAAAEVLNAKEVSPLRAPKVVDAEWITTGRGRGCVLSVAEHGIILPHTAVATACPARARAVVAEGRLGAAWLVRVEPWPAAIP